MGHRSHRNEWRTVGGPHALVFLEANQPRQSLVDPGINHGFEPDYGFETGRRARRRPAPEGSQGRGARPRMSWGAGRTQGSPGPRAHQRARYVQAPRHITLSVFSQPDDLYALEKLSQAVDELATGCGAAYGSGSVRP